MQELSDLTRVAGPEHVRLRGPWAIVGHHQRTESLNTASTSSPTQAPTVHHCTIGRALRPNSGRS